MRLRLNLSVFLMFLFLMLFAGSTSFAMQQYQIIHFPVRSGFEDPDLKDRELI